MKAAQGMKWCTGPCGRELPIEAYRRGPRGISGPCPMCERFRQRRGWKKRAANRAYRAAQVRRALASRARRRAVAA